MNDDILNVISLTMATVALGYPFLKDLWEKPKLKIRAYIAKVYIPGRGEQPEVFSVAITNIGGKPLVVDGHALEHFDGKNSIFQTLWISSLARDLSHMTASALQCLMPSCRQ